MTEAYAFSSFLSGSLILPLAKEREEKCAARYFVKPPCRPILARTDSNL